MYSEDGSIKVVLKWVVVPADSRLGVEAMVENKDIGFAHAGEKAEINVDTFNFTKYGLLHADVVGLYRRCFLSTRLSMATEKRRKDAKTVTSDRQSALAKLKAEWRANPTW